MISDFSELLQVLRNAMQHMKPKREKVHVEECTTEFGAVLENSYKFLWKEI